MLEGLDKIDWLNIWHSHGKADDFPQWLNELASPDNKVRRAAMENVSEYSNHQTSIYPISPIIIPFLIQLLGQEEVRGKSSILGLITALSYENKIDTRFTFMPPPRSAESTSEWNNNWVIT